MTSSLEITDQASAAVAVAPRVTLKDIEDNISQEHIFTAYNALEGMGHPNHPDMKLLTICLMRMKNGYIVIGKSAPASPENFNAELGSKFAREDAIRQLWPVMGYALRDRLCTPKAA